MIPARLREISEDHLQRLVGDRSEDQTIDFKVDIPEGRTLRRIVAAFANTAGGDIVIGMREEERVAAELVGLASDIDKTATQLQQIADRGYQPYSPRAEVQPVGLDNGKTAYVIRVERVLGGPIRLASGNGHFPIRRNGSGDDMTPMEIRDAYQGPHDALRRCVDYRDQRLAEIDAGALDRLESGSGLMLIHIIPFNFDRTLRFRSYRELEQTVGGSVRSFDSEVLHHLRASPLGLAGLDRTENPSAQTTMNRTGIIEFAGRFYILEGSREFSVERHEAGMIRAIDWGLSQLFKLDVSPPFAIFLSLIEMGGLVYLYGSRISRRERAVSDRMPMPPIVLDEYPIDVPMACRDLADLWWNSFGEGSSPHYGNDSLSDLGEALFDAFPHELRKLLTGGGNHE